MTNRETCSHRRHAPLLFCACAMAITFFSSARGAILTTGQVFPSDDPTTQLVVEGIVDYVFDPGTVLNQLADQPDFAHPENIIVGRTGYGQLIINGGSALRYEDLIIGGDEDVLGEMDPDLDGTGVGYVRIEGFGSLYNNDPSILPAPVETAVDSEADFDSTPRTGMGYDVYVGLTGSGTLEVVDGGRMEIQDGLFVGVAPDKFSQVLVSGFGSHIDQRGSGEDMTGTDPDGTPMQIGIGGDGLLTIEAGGAVDAREGVALGVLSLDDSGGSSGIGIPIGGGTGTADGNGMLVVQGSGSVLQAGNGITVGPYFDDLDDYEVTGGTGSLYVRDNGRISVYQTEQIGTGSPAEAEFKVGLSGLVEMDGGRISIAGAYYSDGTLRGDGRINLETFLNRRDGEVIVGEGQRLRIFSTNDEEQTDDNGPYFMANNGLIEVLGGEIEFQRVVESDLDVFHNRIDPGTGGALPRNGRIHGQDAVMRFRSGLLNDGVVAFTAGDNIVQGDVVNSLTGAILLSGNANAVFEDDLTNLGDIELAPDGTAVSLTVLGDFIGLPASSISLALGGGPTGSQLNTMAVTGDVVLGGLLNVDLSANGVSPLNPMPGDEFEIISGTGLLSGAFNALALPMLSNPAWSWGIDTSNSDFTLVVLDIIPIGADFNGDGIVDAADFDIWETNFGIESGATGVLGDADGDGDVDGRDYLLWLQQVGGAGMPVPGAIIGASSTAAVPEPSTIVLLLGSVAAGCWLRLRAA